MDGSEKPWPAMNARQKEIVAFLRECITRQTVSNVAARFDMSTDAARGVLKRLEERGVVAQRQGRWFA